MKSKAVLSPIIARPTAILSNNIHMDNGQLTNIDEKI